MAIPLTAQPTLAALIFAAIALAGRTAILRAWDAFQRRYLPERHRRQQARRRLDALLRDHEGLPGDELPLLEALIEALGLDSAGLFGREPDQDRLCWISGTRSPEQETLPLATVESGTALVGGFASGLTLVRRSQVIGYLVLGHRVTSRGFGKAEQRLMVRSCEHLALGLENQWLGRAVIDEQLAASRADEDRVVQERVNAVVSHQLKTPLLLSQSMLTDAQHALSDRSRVAKRLDKIAGSLARFERNVIQNLDRHRIALGGYELEVAPTELAPLIGRSLDEVRYALGKRGASALVEVASELRVLADTARLEIVFDNLIGNAIKVLPSGGTLSIRAHRTGDRVRIDLSDDGPGIPPARLEGLFSIQAPNPEDPTSTGIGLAICRDYMVGMGGSIELHENGPGGVTFRLELRGVERVA